MFWVRRRRLTASKASPTTTSSTSQRAPVTKVPLRSLPWLPKLHLAACSGYQRSTSQRALVRKVPRRSVPLGDACRNWPSAGGLRLADWKPGGWPVGFRYYRELGFLAHGPAPAPAPSPSPSPQPQMCIFDIRRLGCSSMHIIRICVNLRWSQVQPPDICVVLLAHACPVSMSGCLENMFVGAAKNGLRGWGEGRDF